MTKWSAPIKLAAEVINDAIHCGLDCTSVQTPKWSQSAAEETDAGRPTSHRQTTQRTNRPLPEDFPRSRLQHPKLFRRLLELNEPVAADTSSESTVTPPKSNGMWQSSEGKCSAQSSTAFRDSLTLREDSEVAAEIETDRKPACAEAEVKLKSRHRRQRTLEEDDETTDLQDTRHHSEEEKLPELLRTLNRYIKRTEKQRQQVAQLKRENDTYREVLAMTEIRILQNLESIDELKNRFRRVDEFARRRQGELIALNERHKYMDHDLLMMEELFTRQKQALLMLKAHVLRVYHADASSGSGETTLQNLCVAVMQILSEVNEF